MKRIQGEKVIVGDLTVLTDSQFEKLESPDFRGEIEKLAKRIEVKWAVEVTDNCKILSLTREFSGVVDDATFTNLEIASANFLSAVDKLTLPSLESEEKNEEEENETTLVLQLLDDINAPKGNAQHVVGAMVIDESTHPFCIRYTKWGSISPSLLKKFCELYLKKYGKQEK